MSLHVLDNRLWFPPLTAANKDGLLAMGGDISPERILLAYKQGIFPWYDGNVPLWWFPNPRFVLFPDDIKISKSMNALLKKNAFRFTINNCFKEVVTACRKVDRKDQNGTWINDEIVETYTTLHHAGFAHSAEVWNNNELVGGLYGLWFGNIFFGESMFSLESNASKYAFIKWVDYLQQKGVVLIDCQVFTEHLESLGAIMIDRNLFVNILADHIN